MHAGAAPPGAQHPTPSTRLRLGVHLHLQQHQLLQGRRASPCTAVSVEAPERWARLAGPCPNMCASARCARRSTAAAPAAAAPAASPLQSSASPAGTAAAPGGGRVGEVRGRRRGRRQRQRSPHMQALCSHALLSDQQTHLLLLLGPLGDAQSGGSRGDRRGDRRAAHHDRAALGRRQRLCCHGRHARAHLRQGGSRR